MAWAKYTLDTLIENWGRETQIALNANEGFYDDAGMYNEPDLEWIEDFGILVLMSNNVLMPAELGVYTSQDMYYITRTDMQIGNHVKYANDIYMIHQKADFAYFDQTELYTYIVKVPGRMDNSSEPR